MQMKACKHTDYWDVTDWGADQAKLITSPSSTQVNYPALHSVILGPILRLLFWGLGHAISFTSATEKVFEIEAT